MTGSPFLQSVCCKHFLLTADTSSHAAEYKIYKNIFWNKLKLLIISGVNSPLDFSALGLLSVSNFFRMLSLPPAYLSYSLW